MVDDNTLCRQSNGASAQPNKEEIFEHSWHTATGHAPRGCRTPSAVLFTVHACAPRPCSKYAPRPCLNAPDIRSRPFLESRQQQPASPRYPANSCTAMQGCWITKLQHLALPTYNKEVLSHQLSAETKPSTVDTSQPAPLSNKESERHSQTLETKVMSCVTHSFTFFSMKSRLLCV